MVVAKEWDILLIPHLCFDLHKPGTNHAATNLAELGTDWSRGYFFDIFYFSSAFQRPTERRSSAAWKEKNGKVFTSQRP